MLILKEVFSKVYVTSSFSDMCSCVQQRDTATVNISVWVFSSQNGWHGDPVICGSLIRVFASASDPQTQTIITIITYLLNIPDFIGLSDPVEKCNYLRKKY